VRSPTLPRGPRPLALVEDASWLRSLVTRLTDLHEAISAEPWKVTDAPPSFVDVMLAGIVGVEIPVQRIEGKWKLSQNRPAADRAGTIDGLTARGDVGSLGIAAAMRSRS
jgi:transcriptional regulator